MKIRYLFSVSLVMFVSMFLAECRKSEKDIPATEGRKQLYISIISKGWQHQFWQAVKMGADRAAGDYNVRITFEGPEGDSAVSKQMEMLEAAYNKKPSALIIAACDSKAVIPVLTRFRNAGIPVIGFDSGVESDIPVTTVATDNFLAAGEVADRLAAAIGFKGEVAVLSHDTAGIHESATGTLRRDGFIKRISEKYPKIKIIDIEYGGGDHLISKNLTKKIIMEHSRINGIFATNEGSAIGLINGIVEMKKSGKIVLAGFDAGKRQKDAVRSGIMLGAISQDPVMIGYRAVEAAVKIINKEKLPAFIDTGFKWYDKTNMEKEEFKPLLYD